MRRIDNLDLTSAGKESESELDNSIKRKIRLASCLQPARLDEFSHEKETNHKQ